MELTRRNFLGASALAAAGIAAAGLTGCGPSESSSSSSTSSSESSSTATESTGKNEFIDAQAQGYDFYSTSAFEPDPIADDAIAETVESDIVVVGAGIGGAVAALTAIQNGATVTVLQKEATVLSHGWGIAACNSKVQKEEGYEPDWRAVLNEWARLGENRGDYRLFGTWLTYSGETIDWLYDLAHEVEGVGPMITPPGMKTKYTDAWTQTYSAAHGWTGEMGALATWLIEQAVEGGADVRYSTPGVQLVTENGKVTGVIGKDADGNYIKCMGTVIMSAGDFGNNPGMRARYLPHVEGLPSAYSVTSNTGDGQLMMMAIGGKMQDAPHCSNIHYDPPVGVPNVCGSGVPWLFVNLNGERFSNEDVNYGQLYAQDMLQPEYIHYQVFDSDYPDYYANMGHGMMRDEPSPDYSGIAVGIENGDVLSADTIEELADKMGVPADALSATVERYNELAEKGVDEDFGKNPDYLHPIVTAPFLAIKRRPGVLCTLNGVITNPDMQALDNDGNVIEGLYVTGNCQGNWFGGLEHPMIIPGMSLGRAVVTARIAAMRACGAEY